MPNTAGLVIDSQTAGGIQGMKRNLLLLLATTTILLFVMLRGAAYGQSRPKLAAESIEPGRMLPIIKVDERFQSYNVEMVEVTGGRFWRPYKDIQSALQRRSSPNGSTPAGMDPALYQYRPPIDLSNARLRKLASALGPAFVRVSGTWANSTYFHNSDAPAPKAPPEGFGGVLTRAQWKGVVDFAHAVDAEIVTSFATSAGTRDASGVWTSTQAQHFLDYTHAIGGRIAAAEFMNEPNLAGMGGAPKGYDAAAYARDVAAFRQFIRKAAPEMLFLGPGSVAEGGSSQATLPAGFVRTEDLLNATGPVFDAFSYHLYAAVSKRCAGIAKAMQTSAAGSLSQDWFVRADTISAFYAALRDRFEPGKSLWVTETADAACGGNPWASTFLDTFRYLDEHGRLAKRGVQVIAHNTLASSDYGLLDENTFEPRPNYWAALLWRKLMGATVLDAGQSPPSNLYLYAHCLRGRPGGVALLAINADRQTAHQIRLPAEAERYTLTAGHLEDSTVQLNGTTLRAGSDGSVPALASVHVVPGTVSLAPTSITFLAIPSAGNNACR
jgi:hypothetical protein